MGVTLHRHSFNGSLDERISVGNLLVALGDRATAALLFIFAFPNVLPTPPGTSTVLAAPPWLLRAESLLRPRLGTLARPPMEHLIGQLALLLAVVLVLS